MSTPDLRLNGVRSTCRTYVRRAVRTFDITRVRVRHLFKVRNSPYVNLILLIKKYRSIASYSISDIHDNVE